MSVSARQPQESPLQGPPPGGNPKIEMRGIRKVFGSLVANDDIDLTVTPGEIHALLGENGAGKTTLMNVLYGLYPRDGGEILIDGKPAEIRGPNDAIALGIGMVHQHFMLVDPFTVAENIILGSETTRGFGVLDRKRARAEVERMADAYGLHVNPDALVQDISVGAQQRVEIIKALYRGADVLILDEPTAVLTPQEIDDLIGILHSLTREGKTIVVITHKLREIKEVADRCTIIRRGRRIDTVTVADVDQSELASKMVGRDVKLSVDKGPPHPGEVTLAVSDLRVRDARGLPAVNGLSLSVRRGEILGIAGVDGNGQKELVEAITGTRHVDSGSVTMHGVDITNLTPREVFVHRVSSIPEDRQRRGLVADYTIAENLVLENYGQEPFSKRGILRHDAIREHARELIQKFDVRPPEEGYLAKSLSGGNQQKVIIAREVTNDPDVLIAAQPTRGLDVGAIEYVHRSLVDQRDRGKAVLLVSLDLDEVMNVSDRIAVIYEGTIRGVFDGGEVDEKTLGLLMAGGSVGSSEAESDSPGDIDTSGGEG